MGHCLGIRGFTRAEPYSQRCHAQSLCYFRIPAKSTLFICNVHRKARVPCPHVWLCWSGPYLSPRHTSSPTHAIAHALFSSIQSIRSNWIRYHFHTSTTFVTTSLCYLRRIHSVQCYQSNLLQFCYPWSGNCMLACLPWQKKLCHQGFMDPCKLLEPWSRYPQQNLGVERCSTTYSCVDCSDRGLRCLDRCSPLVPFFF